MITLLNTSNTVASHTDVRGCVHSDFKASIANRTHLNLICSTELNDTNYLILLIT